MLLPMIDPADTHQWLGQCNCCKADAVMNAWHALAYQLDRGISSSALVQDRIKAEGGDDSFLEEELNIAAAISNAYDARSLQIRDILLASVAGGYSPYIFNGVLEDSASKLDTVFEDAKPEVVSALRRALALGARSGGNDIDQLLLRPNARITEEAILNAAKYYTNRYFRQEIIPKIVKGIDDVIYGTEVTPLTAIRGAINQHFRTTPYWNIVANAAASRGYHYGYLKTLMGEGVIGYRIIAIIDQRTSVVCTQMNGKQFLVADAVGLLEGIANSADPEAAKAQSPWRKLEEIQDKNSRELSAMGFLFPPFHALCRTTISPIYG